MRWGTFVPHPTPPHSSFLSSLKVARASALAAAMEKDAEEDAADAAAEALEEAKRLLPATARGAPSTARRRAQVGRSAHCTQHAQARAARFELYTL